MERRQFLQAIRLVGIAAVIGAPASAQDTAATVHALGEAIKQEYFDVGVADRVDAALKQSLAAGHYDGATTPQELAAALNRDLYAVSRDKHLSVTLVRPNAQGRPQTDAEKNAARALGVRRSNGGVRRVEILEGNVGYLDLSSFFRLEEARDAIATAMHLLTRADALIVDMRANGGGSPETVAFFASYFFDEPGLPLFDIIHRRADPAPIDHYATNSPAIADRDATRPVAILTSAKSFSGAEGFPFLLQERHRAEVIGETTAGAANPGRPYPVNNQFEVVVPNGQIRSAVGGGNWEGTGVTPDVKVPAADAVRVARERLLKQLSR